MAFNLKKLRRDIEKATGEAAEQVIKNISKQDKQRIGEAVIIEMKELIAKGVSPIKDAGRFEAYKWAGKKNDALAAIKKRKGTKSFNRAANKQARNAVSNKYPYSVQGEFPSKRERPVNLFLSGDMLSNLIAKVRGGILGFRIEIGYFDELSAKKESGHAEGVNGQPRRATIPTRQQDFSPSIYRRIVEVLDAVLKKQK